MFLLSNCYCQTYLDKRDNNSYSYTEIDNLFWFTKNLNYDVNGSWCYNDLSSCSSEGRLYTFEMAKDICPSGWRIPTSDELIGRDRTGNIWNNKGNKLNPSFSGYRRTKNGGEYKGKGERFAIWAEHKGNAVMASNYPNNESFNCDFVSGGFGLSVRCVTDQLPTGNSTPQISYEDKRSAGLQKFISKFEKTTTTISSSNAQYDGVYLIENGKYYELKENEMSCDHFIFPNEGYPNRYRFWGECPKVCYSLSANRTVLSKYPTKIILKGSHFLDKNIENLSLNPVEVVKLSPNLYFHTGGSNWYDDGYAFLPEWNRKYEKYETIEFRKKKLGENHFEILISGELNEGKSYMITCKDKIWIFTNSNDLRIR